MKSAFHLAVRNIKIFLRDPVSVFFSFLSVIIILGLYILFLGQVNVDNMAQMFKGVDSDKLHWLVNSWIMAGILIVNTITIPLGVFGVMIDDKVKKHMNSFLVAPLKRNEIVFGYLIASWFISILLNLVCFLIAEVYIASDGGQLLSLIATFKVIGLISLSVVSFSCIIFFIVSFLKTMNSFSTLSTIIGTLVGFLTGIYIPIGILPEMVQTVIKMIPFTYGAALMRMIFMEEPVAAVFNGIDPNVKDNFLLSQGVNVVIDGHTVSPVMMILIIIVSGLIFLSLSVMVTKKLKNK